MLMHIHILFMLTVLNKKLKLLIVCKPIQGNASHLISLPPTQVLHFMMSLSCYFWTLKSRIEDIAITIIDFVK